MDVLAYLTAQLVIKLTAKAECPRQLESRTWIPPNLNTTSSSLPYLFLKKLSQIQFLPGGNTITSNFYTSHSKKDLGLVSLFPSLTSWGEAQIWTSVVRDILAPLNCGLEICHYDLVQKPNLWKNSSGQRGRIYMSFSYHTTQLPQEKYNIYQKKKVADVGKEQRCPLKTGIILE